MSIVGSEKLAGRSISLDHVRLAVITDITDNKSSINPLPEAGAELLGHDLPLEVGLLVVIKHVVVLTPRQMHVVLGDDSCVGPLVGLVN